MSIIKFLLDRNFGNYYSHDASDIKMSILALFLTDDASYNPSSFKEYALNDWEQYTSSNATALEKQNGYILLSDLYSEENIPTTLKISCNQFIQLLTDWEEKVLKIGPKEVVIKHENNEFTIETKD
jgi:hypothetical protein